MHTQTPEFLYMQLSRTGWEGVEGVGGNCKSQSFYVVASSKEQPLPLQLCCGHIQKLEQKKEIMQCHKDLKIPPKVAKVPVYKLLLKYKASR